MDKKTVLLLGGTGSLGSAISDRFIKQDHNVIIADLYEPISAMPEFLNVDLADWTELSGHLEHLGIEIDLVINAAASVYGVLGFHKHGGDILVNDLAVHANALRAISEFFPKARFAYISSSMVYEQGYVEKQGYNVIFPGKDSAESYINAPGCWQDYELKAPKTDYGLSKYVGEQMTKSYCKDHKIPYTIWRPFNVITPYEIAREEIGMAHVFADFIRKIITDPEIIEAENPSFLGPWPRVPCYVLELVGDGDQVRCFTWIDEVAQGIADNSFVDETKNQIFNLGREEPITMYELAKMIFEEGKRQGIVLKDATLKARMTSAPSDDVRYRVPVCTKALKVLDWEASVTLKRSIAACVSEAKKRAKKHILQTKPWIQKFNSIGVGCETKTTTGGVCA